ncbi:carbon-nitrogen hydrolase family protein [Defluviimonas sp. WL0024]|uniref:Carbon-nitrogen hydrolase family protein n=1 Tax=Albidovulum salinarum TaxID=2984153 RepID=A0ABT2X548_9RHOB|nr:carbon-nitrogen hydrolase family protein [Defluviimonas sp. WL0024]MCU9848137.1 carbon-nitrogen hydrolase family protein [Defluviimonas sp. WL0024]
MKAALLQLSSSDDPAENLPVVRTMVREAAAAGAGFVLTPEVTNCVSSDRDHQTAVLRHEEDDPTLAALRTEAAELRLWLLIGSLALKTHDADGRFANRSFLIGPDGAIAARYDKIHMFDVKVSEAEQYRESAGYRPGARAVLAGTPFATIGMTVCYDVRFPHLYRRLAKAGAEVLTVPAAFNDTTGAAHWESLLRARAIENGAYVLAPAQTGSHAAHGGRQRRTHGHSLAIAPWGEVICDGGTGIGISYVDLDLAEVAKARDRVPSLAHDRDYEGP